MGLTEVQSNCIKGRGASKVHRPATPDAMLAYTIESATTVSGLSRSRIYQLLASGEIENRKIGRRTMILARSLSDYIERQPPANIRAPKAA